jgi:hypothetical protein
MPKFMNPETALARLAEDANAPLGARVKALQQIAHPSLCLLRRLLVDTVKRVQPVPSKLLAVAALKYAAEIQIRKIRRANGSGRKTAENETNALGI